ncbi:MAG: phosphotransferase family protein [Candidatus Binatus sp.]|jgi:aminoglycoside phosphotransferase (APT) family kinase protein
MLRMNKNAPTLDSIDQLRKRFPCEKEIDRILMRKLQRRSGSGYSPISLETLVKGTEKLIRSEVTDRFEITEAKWLSGGASKLQMSFKLDWSATGRGQSATSMVLRMEPSESISESSRLREFQIIKALADVVPVPPAYWVDHTARFLPYPAIVYGFADGVAKPSTSANVVSGVGTFIPLSLREILGSQFVKHLARIHSFDWSRSDISAFDKPARAIQAVEWELNHWERVWEEDANEDIPLMRLAMSWLRSNMPSVDHVSVVHGDYRTGNFLFTEHDAKISAWLDWEMAYLGDRHADLAWATNRLLGHMAEDHKTFLAGGFLPREEFFAAYEKASGMAVIPKTLKFYDIFGSYKIVVICLATGYRAPRNGKTHQDVLVAWLAGISYSLLEDLRIKLEAVL